MLHATLGGCVINIGNGLDPGNGVSSGSLYKCQGRPQHYDLDLGWLWWLFSLDLDQTPSTASPISNGKYMTKGLLAWTVTDTVAYAFA